MEEIIDNRLRASVLLHDVLHGFRAGRGTGTAILELNLVQELARVDQDPLFLVFLDLCKAYSMVDHGHLLVKLEGNVSVPHMCRILAVFWYQQEVVTHQNGYHGPHFRATRGITQGGLILPTLFNFIFDNMVRNWLSLSVEDQLVAQEGLLLVVSRCL